MVFLSEGDGDSQVQVGNRPHPMFVKTWRLADMTVLLTRDSGLTAYIRRGGKLKFIMGLPD